MSFPMCYWTDLRQISSQLPSTAFHYLTRKFDISKHLTQIADSLMGFLTQISSRLQTISSTTAKRQFSCHDGDDGDKDKDEERKVRDMEEDIKIKRQIYTNTLIINFCYFATTSEIPFNRFAFKSKILGYIITQIRFLIFALIFVQFCFIIFKENCETAKFRNKYLDWTVYYRVEDRYSLKQLFLLFGLTNLMLKRSIFIRTSKFDSSLFDFLVNYPPIRVSDKHLSKAEQVDLNDGSKLLDFDLQEAIREKANEQIVYHSFDGIYWVPTRSLTGRYSSNSSLVQSIDNNHRFLSSTQEHITGFVIDENKNRNKKSSIQQTGKSAKSSIGTISSASSSLTVATTPTVRRGINVTSRLAFPSFPINMTSERRKNALELTGHNHWLASQTVNYFNCKKYCDRVSDIVTDYIAQFVNGYNLKRESAHYCWMKEFSNRDGEHWHYVSDSLSKWFIWMAITFLLPCWFIGITVASKLLFVRTKTRQCDIDGIWHRRLGAFTQFYIWAEISVVAVGGLMFMLIIYFDLYHQATRAKNHAEKVLAMIDEEFNNKNFTKEHFKLIIKLDNSEKQYTESLTSSSLVDTFGNHVIAAAAVNPTTNDSSLSSKNQKQTMQFGTGISMTSESRSSSQKLNCMHKSLFVRLEELLNSRREVAIDFEAQAEFSQLIMSKGPVLRQPKVQVVSTVKSQLQVVSFLSSLDKHKPFVSFLGNYSFLLLVAVLIYIPSYIRARVTGTANNPAQVVRIVVVSFALISVLSFSTCCANITRLVSTDFKNDIRSPVFSKNKQLISTNYKPQAVGLSSLIFRLGARDPSCSSLNYWNRVTYRWYCPNKCAFKIIGMFDVTNVNILQVSLVDN